MALPNLSGIPPVDFKNLQDLRAQPLDEGSLFDRIYPIFKKESPGLLAKIEENLDLKDSEGVYEPMHKLKGSASAMGASRLFELCQSALEMCRGNTIFDEPNLMHQLTVEIDAYQRTIDSLFPEYA
ncbi:Hpt domain-containing protein [Puniceicoccaceae bacterium K14]|nr:Hpt domain-containing protein [Puniceicoccaceae bacterium K14]